MGSIGLLIVGSIMMAGIQISIFKSLPRFLRVLFAYLPLAAMLCNFLLSGVILIFTGVGNTVGLLNLAGSIIFGIYLFIYKDYRKCQITFKRRFWIFPKLELTEGNKQPHWLF